MPHLSVVVTDITSLEIDAIVNAANEQLLPGSGVCGAIFRAAGPALQAACRNVAPCPTGEARMTPGFRSKARWIVHAVGPIWHGGSRNEPQQLASAYRESLRLAREAGAASIAFPAISTGVYGYPPEAAAQVAIGAVREWCRQFAEPAEIVFCCFSETDAAIYNANL
jgi:O-acetyl-ADP-ribose deacetylase